jgi:hypothetical protein
MKIRRLPLGLSLTLLIGGSLGIGIARTTIEVFLCSELVTISVFYIFFTIIIPATRPSSVDTEAIFLGGLARSPYLSGSELFSVGIPVISEDIDDSWENYFDRNRLEPNEEPKEEA